MCHPVAESSQCSIPDPGPAGTPMAEIPGLQPGPLGVIFTSSAKWNKPLSSVDFCYMHQIDEITCVARERVTPGEFGVNVKNNPENNKYCVK